MTKMTARQARAGGYKALTGRYELPEEEALLERVLADMKRGRIRHVLVKEGRGVAVWRR
jgi:hypothetical protein